MKKGVMPYTASLPTTQTKYLKQVIFSRKIEWKTSRWIIFKLEPMKVEMKGFPT